ncbi:glycosyl transferase family 2 [Thermocrinis albus DSM 14484]|uniref:Glycosyl transferase family 2 n=1 Tax=Thermocrinis albus (strain DSM 14484 / JCM 11386 / HI 11/12) TaxID=638303 RepID=D3SNX0_THEAH|nr:glycosyltransferase family 2 protein [Thermocrinis albus]ADC88857.1 glycosyl transferase family 2 [Thermocrinis albus DSM 14484]
MKVSVVIPVYNGENFVARAIESALAQTYPVEVVVVDDASTDNTSKIVSSYPVVYYRNQYRQERCLSRNLGVEISSGDVIFFLDHDDLWDKDHVIRMLSLLEDAQVLYSVPRTFVDGEGRVIRRSHKKIPKDPLLLLFGGEVGYPSACAFRRNAFLGYRNEYLHREDWELLLRSAVNGLKIKIVDTDTVMIRDHPHRNSYKNIKLYTVTLKIYEDYVGRIPVQYVPAFTFHVGDVCLRFGDFKRGWAFVFKAFTAQPSILMDKRRILNLLKRGFRLWRRLPV